MGKKGNADKQPQSTRKVVIALLYGLAVLCFIVYGVQSSRARDLEDDYQFQSYELQRSGGWSSDGIARTNADLVKAKATNAKGTGIIFMWIGIAGAAVATAFLVLGLVRKKESS